jgi:hypothetical protein
MLKILETLAQQIIRGFSVVLHQPSHFSQIDKLKDRQLEIKL